LASEKNMRLIFVPHEATKTFIDRMTKDVKNAGLNYQLFSDGGSWSNDVLIVDRTGYLAELYAHASMAFVGGSFRRKVHSVMEALAAGLVTFVGPRHLNNREATSFQKVGLREGVSAVISIEDGLEMFEKVAWLLDADIVGPQIKDMIVAEVARRRGATDKVL